MFEEEVSRGAKLLDKVLGSLWPLQLDFSKLNMASCEACVLGQLMGGYLEGLCMLLKVDEGAVSGGTFGFDLPDTIETKVLWGIKDDLGFTDEEFHSANAGMYMNLEETWLKEVKSRLNGGMTF